MNKNIIRLTESELKKVITESVKRILKEDNNTFKYDCTDYRDIYTTCGIYGQHDFMRIYERLENFLKTSNSTSDWEYLKLEEPMYLIKSVKHVTEYMLFKTKTKNEAPQEVISLLKQLVDNVKNEETPDLWIGRLPFGDIAKNIRNYLKQIYEIYSDFVDSLMELHENGEMKQQDIDADWEKYNRTIQNDKEEQIEALYGELNHTTGAFRNNLKRTALTRYDIVDNPDDEYNQKYHNFLMGNY